MTYKTKLTPQQRAEKNRRQREYYHQHREEISMRAAERRAMHPPKKYEPRHVDFDDNPDRDEIIRLIQSECGGASGT